MNELIVVCVACSRTFSYVRARKGGGRTRQTCDICREKNRKEKQRDRDRRYRSRQGRAVGCGTGGNQKGEKNHMWKGGRGSKYYRPLCFKHHGNSCVHCGADENVEVHHIDGDRDNNSPENLRPVCKSCHRGREHRCWEHLQNLTPEQLAQAESKRVRDEKGRYTGRNKTGEICGDIPETGQPEVKDETKDSSSRRD